MLKPRSKEVAKIVTAALLLFCMGFVVENIASVLNIQILLREKVQEVLLTGDGLGYEADRLN